MRSREALVGVGYLPWQCSGRVPRAEVRATFSPWPTKLHRVRADLAPRCDQAYKGDLINRGKRLVRSSKAPFDPKKFLAKVGGGKTILYYRKNQIVFSQGEVADAVFYIQQGNIKLVVVSEHGKEAVAAILGAGDFFGEGCLNGHLLLYRARKRR